MTKTKTKAAKHYIVVLADTNGKYCAFLGTLNKGDRSDMRQGVTRRVNATRFTERGAARVAAEYSGAFTMHEDGDCGSSLAFEIK